MPTLPKAGQFLQVAGRVSTLSASTVSCYFLRVTPSTGIWDLRKKINGAGSTSIKTFSAPFAAGDGAGLRIAGSTITAYRKPGTGAWTAVGSATDTAIPAGGYLSFTLERHDHARRRLRRRQRRRPPSDRPPGPDGDRGHRGAPVLERALRRRRADHRLQPLPRHQRGRETLYKSLGNVTSYDDNAVTGGTNYYYRVAAVNSVGEGTQSNEVSATPAAPPSGPRPRR